jgi:hypothetical protein
MRETHRSEGLGFALLFRGDLGLASVLCLPGCVRFLVATPTLRLLALLFLLVARE